MNSSRRIVHKVSVVTAGVVTLGLSGSLSAGEGAHWGYSEEAGPERWGELDSAYSTCAAGKNQSPIDLANMIEGELTPLQLNYRNGGHEVVNNGHTIQVNYSTGSTIDLGGNAYELKQFHFHSPSENTVEGRSFPMEGHLVHADTEGNLAVVSIMFEEGAENPGIHKAWERMPENAGDKNSLSGPVNATTLLPPKQDYYRFNGSLTTPPCSEGVVWLVLKQPSRASKEQIAKFTHVMQHPNNRPLQSLNARMVIK